MFPVRADEHTAGPVDPESRTEGRKLPPLGTSALAGPAAAGEPAQNQLPLQARTHLLPPLENFSTV